MTRLTGMFILTALFGILLAIMVATIGWGLALLTYGITFGAALFLWITFYLMEKL